MRFTFSTVVNIVLFSSIASLLFYLLLDKCKNIMIGRIKLLSFLMAVTALRLFLPIELPTQKNILIYDIWPDIYVGFVNKTFILAGKERTLLSILLTVWLLGSVIFVIKMLFSYMRIRLKVQKLSSVKYVELNQIVDEINTAWSKSKQFEIVFDETINTPIIFGLSRPYIIIPQLDLNREEWRYILKHEMSHYYYKDLLIRFMCELLQAVYWWNPFVYLLRKQISKVQELRVDETMISDLSNTNRLDYMNCLTKLAKLQIKDTATWTAAFSSDNEGEVSKRITRLLQNTGTCHRFTLRGVFMLLVLTVVVLWPNFFIMEPHAMAEEHKNENFFTITKENAYCVLNAEGTYNLYVNNEFMGIAETVFDETLTIYNEEGEIINGN